MLLADLASRNILIREAFIASSAFAENNHRAEIESFQLVDGQATSSRISSTLAISSSASASLPIPLLSSQYLAKQRNL
jgi:hypothetical protein